MQQFVHNMDRYDFECSTGVSDGSGTLAFPRFYNDASMHGSSIDFVTVGNVPLRDQYSPSERMTLLEQRSGLVAIGDPGHMWPLAPAARIGAWDSSGNPEGSVILFAQSLAVAGDPAGGLFLAGDLSTTASGPLSRTAVMYTGGGTPPAVRWGPEPLASMGGLLAAGVDVRGRALVITDGAPKFGAGNISAQWFDRDGTALTGEFVLLTGFVPQSCVYCSTWFETSALIGGGLLVKRRDLVAVVDGYHFSYTPSARALVVVASGAASVRPAPGWMTSRPDGRLQIARGGRAYAVLPYGANEVACSQRIEVVAPDGTSCGTADYPLSTTRSVTQCSPRDYPTIPGACNTHDLTLGADGTVIQQLPLTMETWNDNFCSTSCTWRWWPGTLK
jgi:hypothetical protein